MYLDQYGLSAPPFQLTPDGRFWFESATHRKAMAYLGYGLQQGEGFIVITGDAGTGKSTLVDHLIARLDPSRVKAVNITASNLDSDGLIRIVAHGFGVTTDQRAIADVIGQLMTCFAAQMHAGLRNVLFVDEAQLLDVPALEELRTMASQHVNGQSLLQIVLVGQVELQARLKQPALTQLQQRVIASHSLSGMDAAEVADYLNHRLSMVGWQGRPQFAADAVAAIYRHSGGLPRRVNMLAQRALMLGAMEHAQIIDSRIVQSVAMEAAQETVAQVDNAMSRLATDPASLDASARISVLEAQVTEQDAALRRVLSLLIDWMESEPAPPVQTAYSSIA